MARQFLAGLLDEVRLQLVPAVLGPADSSTACAPTSA
jgi:hypothetical protein